MSDTPPRHPPHRASRRAALALGGLALVLVACLGDPVASPSSASATASPSTRASVEPSAPSAEPTPATTPTDGRVAAGVAFVRAVDGIEQVFVVEADGSARQVTGLGQHAAVGAVQPLWSPDRSMIAFAPPAIGAGLEAQLWIVHADGGQQRPLAVAGEFIDWSPDSARLVWTDSVFTSDNRGEPPRLWIGTVASGRARVLGVLGNDTRWLPDGERISYVPYEPPREPRVVVMRPDGGDRQPLVEGSGVRWSPDGTTVAFERADGIYLADADGADVRLLLEGRASPVWSPDGDHLAFVDVDPSGNFVVGVATRDGAITWEGAPGIDPAWSPDGTHLVVDLTVGEPLVGILDATTGERVWLFEGRFPDW